MDGIIEAFKIDSVGGLIAQLVGFVPLIISFFTFLLSKRGSIIVSKLISDLLWAFHFLLLGEFVGCIINFVNAIRDFVFFHKDKKWASHISVPIIFGVLTVGAAFVRWQGWYSILPMLGSLLALIGFWCSNPRHIKKFNLPATALWLIYGIIVGSISTVLCNLFSIISIIISETRDFIQKRKNQVQQDK